MKIDLIDHAFNQFRIQSIADLGGVWGIDAAYTFYVLEKYPIERAYLVDTDITERVVVKKKLFPKLNTIADNFGSNKIVEKIGTVDAILMFDILLHQVAPDWNEILAMYSRITRYVIIVNPQYSGKKTVRLIDLGVNEYFKNVPHSSTEEPYISFIQRMYQEHPQHRRKYRDIHNVWQWGITNADLIETMRHFGFENVYQKNYGQWGNLKNFENNAFIFKKKRRKKFFQIFDIER